MIQEKMKASQSRQKSYHDKRRKDLEVKKLRGKEIPLVKVVWEGAAGESLTWELESKMLESYPGLFT